MVAEVAEVAEVAARTASEAVEAVEAVDPLSILSKWFAANLLLKLYLTKANRRVRLQAKLYANMIQRRYHAASTGVDRKNMSNRSDEIS